MVLKAPVVVIKLSLLILDFCFMQVSEEIMFDVSDSTSALKWTTCCLIQARGTFLINYIYV